MATTKSTTPARKRSTAAKPRSAAAAKPRAATTAAKSSAKADDSLIARTGRTLKQRPYTSAAIATGAVAAAAAVGAAGAFLYSRRDKSFKEASDELTSKVKDGLASASELAKSGIASATETVKDLGQRGSDYLRGDGSSETRSQQQIAEEALSLKETGAAKSPVDELSASEIKTGAVAY